MNWKPPINPWERADLANDEIAALQSVRATDVGAKALTVIVTKFARTYDLSFRPGGSEGERATAFAEGMRSVGTAILEALQRPMKPSGDQNATTSTKRPGRRNPKPTRPRDKPAKPTAGNPAGG